ncbi:DUF11 domain-containing protein [Streptomyces sp. HNM0574]|uniref:DUF11 domain-containing protein n=1 Tax=Streptomyces sp. HNM0574 TaxID=2714954 RepID=UPI00146D42E5|nr:DUF11 domain-containing protein [Streptomyces sp. HNM0574]NLU68084.1 DUF11 domain-containing protein [Streptomyces sp. HNM0574]
MSRLSRGAAASVVLLLSAAPVAAAASTPAAQPAPVDVRVANEGKSLREGASTRYTITLRNTSARDLKGLTVTQTMPASLHPSGSEPKAYLKPGRASWYTDLPAKGTVRLSLDGDVGTIAEHEAGQAVAEEDPKRPETQGDGRGTTAVRLSTSVCVQESVRVRDGKAAPQPENPEQGGGGEESAERRRGNTVGRIIGCASDADVLHASPSGASADGGGHPWLYGSAGAALVLAGGAAFVTYRRRAGRAG